MSWVEVCSDNTERRALKVEVLFFCSGVSRLRGVARWRSNLHGCLIPDVSDDPPCADPLSKRFGGVGSSFHGFEIKLISSRFYRNPIIDCPSYSWLNKDTE